MFNPTTRLLCPIRRTNPQSSPSFSDGILMSYTHDFVSVRPLLVCIIAPRYSYAPKSPKFALKLEILVIQPLEISKNFVRMSGSFVSASCSVHLPSMCSAYTSLLDFSLLLLSLRPRFAPVVVEL
ncbi:hypothetical protein SDJN03_30339, partial [Cucurbita argyrosperma subsp. sororia]